ncbi:nitrite reductase (cytochrome; ammonia-forming) [Campylobacter sputorum subsp. bubulus]|uniref:nitrite reductase (cytochrome; ammonia-forming) n=1 Tax=Campylobacter sputorum subsp. sputorum TaxID=32024 RepID=A0A381DJ30_9BACT|nr:ammonia-forming cytochrome c nitrite reductase subunit c552 [Campylobacter sputorum]ASM35720.1 formate-dependent nitrite reductase NrfAH, periplasmic pentaheme cytochrome c subunit [Campylobacter sputorum aubsp. sputorum RM3237]KAB0580684.1 ammonia-forming cytochrome c nitrite reductase subunit c552 [Campylobacter sputorum subsp. sputorum]QEL05910.1 formate-dependent nitrite reductase NrfAH, periplasmic pentaheme cytochrome c subunit [Campylobacter sputorum subsp. sputorum]SUX09000.1 nitrite
MKKNGILFTIAFLIAVILGGAMFALFADIGEKKAEERQYPMMLHKVSDLDPDIEKWGKNFPSQFDSFIAMRDINFETPFAGSMPYSKLIRWPAATVFWDGYAFAVDYNRPRLHYYSQIDQIETKRNDKGYLNSHGLPKFKGQPGACVNCHTGHLTAIINDPDYHLSENPVEAANRPMGFFDVDKENGAIKKAAWTKMNSMPYFDVMKMVANKHGEDAIKGSHLGSSCADCHNPDDMSLRVTRPAFVNAMVQRGYEADVKTGLKATRAEMRSYVCMQCHVEYYFQGKDSTLTFPWSKWPKDKPFKIEMFDEYYDEAFENGSFKFDYKHKQTDASIIKMQHPEAELSSSGIHARNGVSCADCHMPYERVGAMKVTNHTVQTPYANITASCKTCHMQDEKELISRIEFIQNRHAHELRNCENSLLSLIADIKTGRGELAKHSEFVNLNPDEQKAAISEVLKDALKMHRKAHIRWDFAFSENSYGFHAPEEAARIIGQCQEYARQGQIDLANALSKYGVSINLTKIADKPATPEQITSHKAPTASKPSAELLKIDEKVKNLNFD